MAMPDILKLKIEFNNWCLLIICICVIIEYVACSERDCSRIRSKGYTVGTGDITVKYGDPLEIICSLNDDAVEQNYNSSKIWFEQDNVPISKEYVEILNSTSSRLRIENHPKTRREEYYCMYDCAALSFNVIAVGVPPQPVTDFHCRSYNYEKLVCSWTPPENYVNTSYNITYYLPGSHSMNPHECPAKKIHQNCTWSLSTNPQYRHAHDNLNFILSISNVFGSIKQTFKISTWKYVIPNAPQNLTGKAVSPYSIKLTWFNGITFPPGTHHRILYYSEFEPKWQLATIITDATKNRSLEYTMTGLKYAYTVYDIRISMRSAVANTTDESLWSNNSTVIVRTLPNIPDRPPKTDVGSFEVINKKDSRDVYIYWQRIKKEEENGENLTYLVEMRYHPTHRPKELKKAFAKFENLSVDTSYTFDVWSSNEMGRSTSHSVVKVPSDQERVPSPENVMKVTHSDQLDEIKWTQPKTSGKSPTSYTVFWCTSSTNRDRPSQCDGFLNWVTLNNSFSSYNKSYTNDTPELIDQFAVSANTMDGSSGMFWAQCTVAAENVGGKLTNVYSPTTGTTWIQISWTQSCLNKNPSIIGYEILYCPVVYKNCTEPIQSLIIEGDSSTYMANITGLNDYTTYKIQIGARTHYNNASQFSEPYYKETLEGAPLPPKNISVSNITATSMMVSWVQPSKAKQYIKYNLLYYNDSGKPIDVNRDDTSSKVENLTSYKGYTIYLRACTVSCSINSEKVFVETKMSTPSKIRQPNVSAKQATNITIQWDRPEPPNGPINYYELRYAHDGNKTVNNTRSQSKSIECTSKVRISVRAVNIDDDGTHFEGPWSEELDYDCSGTINILLYLGVAVGFSFLAGLSYYAPKVYAEVKFVKNFKPELPSGLKGDVSENENLPAEEADPPSSRVKLLEVFTDNIDSSGCSSGQESIASSVQSSTRISSSDSGTEHLNRSPPTSVILRKRNSGALVDSPTPSVRSATQPPSAPYVYYGDPTSTQNDNATNSPQIPLNTLTPKYVTTDSSAYVICEDMSKPPNPGYVPYTSQEPALKNTEYVQAGIPTPKMFVPEMLVPSPIDKQPAYNETPKNVQLLWQHAPINTADLSKTGYVTVGDAAPPPKIAASGSGAKGYVPHKQFEMKSFKKD